MVVVLCPNTVSHRIPNNDENYDDDDDDDSDKDEVDETYILGNASGQSLFFVWN